MANIYETPEVDAASGDTTVYEMSTGDSFFGSNQTPYADRDAVRVNLTAGVAYTFTMSSTSDFPYHAMSLGLAGESLFFIEDSFGEGATNAVITYTPTESGTFYLVALPDQHDKLGRS